MLRRMHTESLLLEPSTAPAGFRRTPPAQPGSQFQPLRPPRSRLALRAQAPPTSADPKVNPLAAPAPNPRPPAPASKRPEESPILNREDARRPADPPLLTGSPMRDWFRQRRAA